MFGKSDSLYCPTRERSTANSQPRPSITLIVRIAAEFVAEPALGMLRLEGRCICSGKDFKYKALHPLSRTNNCPMTRLRDIAWGGRLQEPTNRHGN